MATIDRQGGDETTGTLGGVPSLLFNGQRLDQPTFHEHYSRMDEDFRAELIDGVVHLMAMSVFEDHGRPDVTMGSLLFLYSVDTPGTVAQGNTSTILGPRSEVQPDSALLIEPAYGGQTFRGADGCTNRCPELVVEIANTTLRRDLKEKKQAYEEAGALEYLVFDVAHDAFHWFVSREGRFEPFDADPDGVYRSRVFPGLWLDAPAFVGGRRRDLIETLRQGLASPEHGDFVARLAQYRADRP